MAELRFETKALRTEVALFDRACHGLSGKALGDRVWKLAALAGANLAAKCQLVPIIPRIGGCTKMLSALEPEHACRQLPTKYPPQLLPTTASAGA